MSWEEVQFESLYAIPSRNGVYKSQEFRGTGYRMVNMGELFGYDFISSQEMSRIQLSETEYQANRLEDGDLLFGRRSLVESGAGKCSVVVSPSEPTVFESSIIRVRLDQHKTNPKFLFYYFKSHQGRGRVSAIVSGVNVKGIRGSDLKNIMVAKPPLPIQNRIVDILSAYDDLIENNRRRIDLLEQSARMLYKEWFISLRFPGHEHVKVKDGVPQGWERGMLSDFFDTTSGGTPSRSQPEYYLGDINWVKTQELNENFIFDTEEKITEEAITKSSAKLFPENTLLVSIYGGTNIGRTGILARPSACNQACVALFPIHQSANPYFAQLFLQNVRENLIGMSQGAAQTNISQQVLRQIEMTLPNTELMQSFLEFVSPLYDQKKTLEQQTVKLQQARDLLLPRLMNGEIPV